ARSTRARPRPVCTSASSPSSTLPPRFASSTIGTPGVKNGSPTTNRPRRLTSTTSEEGEGGGKGGAPSYVRLHAPAGDVVAGRRQVAGARQLQRCARREPVDLLDERLSVGRQADDHGSPVVLERPGDDFGRARAGAVDKHGERRRYGDVPAPVVVR